ncbi:MAG TPA: alpha/beta hydrolase [Microlunatus sp.]|jgi:pimeloyl-ACP methyl ester carboxylesterase|nr:alpha/beta hydrolase [Microlunatus sp.]
MTTTTTSRREELIASVPVQERTVHAAGVETAVLEGGRGEPLVLLHGPGESAVVWLPVLGQLVASHRVVAADLPGHGASAAGPSPLRREWVDSWLVDLIAATCTTPPALVGRVVGGAVAAQFAASHSDSLTHLVLVDTMGLEPFSPDARFGLAMRRFLADPSIASYERFMEFCAFDLDSARRHLAPRWTPYAEYAVEQAADQRVQVAIGGLLGLYGATPIPTETWAAIEVPVSLIWGRHDAATPVGVAERAATVHGWSLRVIEGAGDDPALDRPAEFLAALDEVLAARTGRTVT